MRAPQARVRLRQSQREGDLRLWGVLYDMSEYGVG